MNHCFSQYHQLEETFSNETSRHAFYTNQNYIKNTNYLVISINHRWRPPSLIPHSDAAACSISLLGHQAHFTFSSGIIRWVSLLFPWYHSLVKIISIYFTHSRLPYLAHVNSIFSVVWAMNLWLLVLLPPCSVNVCISESLSTSNCIYPSLPCLNIPALLIWFTLTVHCIVNLDLL